MMCTVESCDRPVRVLSRGLCNAHYQRLFKYGDPLGTPNRPSKSERFMAKVRRAPNGCWNWAAYIDAGTGYGRLNIEWAHRVSYELHVGPIPAGLHVDHLCRNRACVNPAHLEAVPPRINVLRGQSPSAVTVRTNHCQRGHELTPANTYYRPDGTGRQCRECIRMRTSRQTARRAAERNAA